MNKKISPSYWTLISCLAFAPETSHWLDEETPIKLLLPHAHSGKCRSSDHRFWQNHHRLGVIHLHWLKDLGLDWMRKKKKKEKYHLSDQLTSSTNSINSKQHIKTLHRVRQLIVGCLQQMMKKKKIKKLRQSNDMIIEPLLWMKWI